MTPEELRSLVKSIAKEHGLDPKLVCALIEQESGWNTWAIRYEPGFYRRYIEPMEHVRRFGSVSVHTERTARATSFGLMQVMGQVAREYGCELVYLTELCDPAQGLRYGCKKLARELERKGSIEAGLLAYNGGGNPDYPAEVLNRTARYA